MAEILPLYLPSAHDRDLDLQISWLVDTMLIELGQQPGRPARPGRIRGGRVIMVIGKAGAGKSRAIDNALGTRPEFEGYGKEGQWSPILSVVAPSPFTLGTLGNEIVRKLGYHSRREIQHTKVWPVVSGLLAERGIRIVWIDEAQHGDAITNRSMMQEVESTFKRMMQDSDWPVWLILSGLPEIARFCQEDSSMRRRVSVVKFKSLSFPDHVSTVCKAVRRIAVICPGLEHEALLTDEFVHRLLHAAMYQFGTLVEYIQDAIGECLAAQSDALSVGHFADIYAIRTGETDDALNVFLAKDWTSISVETALYEEILDESGKPRGGRKLQQRRMKGMTR